MGKRGSENNLSPNVEAPPGLKRSKSSNKNVTNGLEITLQREDPNVRVGIVLDSNFEDRAIVKKLHDGTPAAATRSSPSAALQIKAGDEILSIDGVRVQSATHMVQLIKQNNKLSITVTKSRSPVSRS